MHYSEAGSCFDGHIRIKEWRSLCEVGDWYVIPVDQTIV